MLGRVNRVAAALAVLLALLDSTGCRRSESGEGQSAGTVGSERGPEALHEAAGRVQVAPPDLVVLVSIDTLRADHLGAYGYERFTSPILDMVASEGVLFEDASAASPWTLPSHASILTGSFPLRHGVESMKTALPERATTLASVLSQHGYETAAVVNSTWLKRETFGLTRDFDHYRYVPDIADRRTPTTWVTDQALEWMKQPGRGKLFLFVHYYDVHADYASEPAYEELFETPYDGIADGSGWQLLQANLDEEYLAMCQREEAPEQCSFGTIDNRWVVDSTTRKLHFDPDDVRHLTDLYDAGIRQLDTELGRLFAGMRSAGLFEDALIVITSDHGEEFMEHGRFDHFLPTWQELLHVPLILRGPGIPSGARIDAPVSSVDIAPTILSLTGAMAPASMDGLDLTSLMRGEVPDAFATRFLYAEAAGGRSYDLVARGHFPVYRSVRRGAHKLVYDSKSDRYALFDLDSDPGEQRDLSAGNPELTRPLVAEMRRRYAEVDERSESRDAVELSEEEIERLRSLGYLQ